MRDTFRKELTKRPTIRSGQGGGTTKGSTWLYFQSMMFLKDQFVSRNILSSIPDLEMETQSEDNNKEPQDLAEEDSDADTNLTQNKTSEVETENPIESPSIPPPVKRAKTVKLNAIEKLLDIEQQKLKEFKKKVEVSSTEKITQDADYHFLMSLLPYLRKVPEKRKMLVRMKLQQIFCDENDIARQPYPTSSMPNSSTNRPSYFSGLSPEEYSQHTVENYSSSAHSQLLTTPSGPSSEECAQEHYENLSSYFSTSNPNQ